MKKQIIIAGLGIGSLLLSSCGTMTPENKQLFAMETGGMIGSATGFLIGDQIGGWGGSVIGSALGGVAGSVIGAAATNPNIERSKHSSSSADFEGQSYARFHSGLSIKDIILEDENGNKRIDRNEFCSLTFIIKNEGLTNVQLLTPELTPKKNAKYIKQSQPLPIRGIKPSETIWYRVKLWASPKLKSGEAQYTIRLNTGSVLEDYEESFSIPTTGR